MLLSILLILINSECLSPQDNLVQFRKRNKISEIDAHFLPQKGKIAFIKNDKIGIWDKNKELNEKYVITPELIIGECEGDPHKVFHRIGPVISDQAGNIYVCEFMDGQIQKFSKNGDFLKTIGTKGQGPGDLAMPMATVFEKNENLCVLELGNSRISRFDSNGEFKDSFKINTRVGTSKIAIDSTGNFYISSWDEETDKIIHKYDGTGNLLNAFCDPVEFSNPLSVHDRMVKKNISGGPVVIFNKSIYYSRFNPYEIQVFSLDGHLKKRIFRENDFMPPAHVSVENGGKISFKLPVASIFLGIWQNKLINQVKIPKHFATKIRTIIDIFNLDGKLLTTLKLEENISIYHIDAKGKIYAVTVDDDGIERVVRYRLYKKNSDNKINN